jgi:hypothetical protein
LEDKEVQFNALGVDWPMCSMSQRNFSPFRQRSSSKRFSNLSAFSSWAPITPMGKGL